MSYPEIVTRAFRLWWRVRALWPLGVLAALFGAGDYATGSLNLNLPADSLPGGAPDALLGRLESSPLLRALVANPIPFIIGVVLVAIAWALIAALVGQLAHGAMIRMADQADQGFAASIGDALQAGAARLLPLFLIAVLTALPIVLAVVAIAALVAVVVLQLSTAQSVDSSAVLRSVGLALLCAVPLFLVTLFLGAAIGLLARLAQRVCVLEGLGALGSLRRALRLLLRNLGPALLNWLALAILGALFGVAATLPALAIALPAFFSLAGGGDIPWATLVVLLLYGLAVTVLLGGVLTSFNSALWTLLYRSFIAREGAAAPPAGSVG